jgi:DNA processing protein
MTPDKRYWLGFNLVRGIGAVRLRALLDHFGDAEGAWKGSPEELRAAGLGQKTVARLVALREDVDLDLLWRRAEAQGVNILTSEDDAYPRRLREMISRRRCCSCVVNGWPKMRSLSQLSARAASPRMAGR